jgi:hypothetical protein
MATIQALFANAAEFFNSLLDGPVVQRRGTPTTLQAAISIKSDEGRTQ